MATDATGTPTSLGIPTFDTSTDAPSGLGHNAAMAFIDAILQDRVTAAGTRILANKLLTGDAQPAFKLMGDGKMQWGAGGSSAVDTTLYRLAAGELQTDGLLVVTPKPGFTPGLLVNAAGNAAEHYVQLKKATADFPMFLIDSSGELGWGPGDAVTNVDTSLYRSAPNALATGGDFTVSNNFVVTHNGYFGDGVVVDNGGSGGKLYFGNALDTNLYRTAAGVLRTDGSLVLLGADTNGYGLQVTGGNLAFLRPAGSPIITQAAVGDPSYRFFVDGSGKILWGPGNVPADTNLYRWAAGYLKTDNQMIALQGFNAAGMASAGLGAFQSSVSGDTQPRLYVSAEGKMEWGPGGSTAPDTFLYRDSISRIKTDGAFHAQRIVANPGGGVGGANEISIWDDGKMYFSSGDDTNLYRSAASTLKTDGKLVVGTDLSVSGNAAVTGNATVTGNLTVSGTITGVSGAGTELAYATHTSVSAGSGTLIVDSGSHTYDGAAVMIEYFTQWIGNVTGAFQVRLDLYDGAGFIQLLTRMNLASTGEFVPVVAKARITPSAGSHDYRVVATTELGANPSVQPGYIRITKV